MTNAEKIIIYRFGSLGDTIVALPCFHRIARSFPGAERILLTNIPVSSKAAPLEEILGQSGLIGGSLAYPVGTRSPARLWRLMREIRAHRATTMIHLMPVRGLWAGIRDFLFFRLSGIRRIIGLPLARDLRTNHLDPATGFEEPEHARLARTIASLGNIDFHDRDMWDLALTAEEQSVGRQLVAEFSGRPFFAVNMGGKAAEKDWGPDNWSELFVRLSEHFSGYGLLIVGASEDSTRAQSLKTSWRGVVVDACGRLSPRESSAALKHADLFIGHDSGPLHLASAAEVACIGLFGDFNRPRKWHPFGKRNHIIHNMQGMSAISVDEVVDAVKLGAIGADVEI
jgi:heptosyltransferase III